MAELDSGFHSYGRDSLARRPAVPHVCLLRLVPNSRPSRLTSNTRVSGSEVDTDNSSVVVVARVRGSVGLDKVAGWEEADDSEEDKDGDGDLGEERRGGCLSPALRPDSRTGVRHGGKSGFLVETE